MHHNYALRTLSRKDRQLGQHGANARGDARRIHVVGPARGRILDRLRGARSGKCLEDQVHERHCRPEARRRCRLSRREHHDFRATRVQTQHLRPRASVGARRGQLRSCQAGSDREE